MGDVRPQRPSILPRGSLNGGIAEKITCAKDQCIAFPLKGTIMTSKPKPEQYVLLDGRSAWLVRSNGCNRQLVKVLVDDILVEKMFERTQLARRSNRCFHSVTMVAATGASSADRSLAPLASSEEEWSVTGVVSATSSAGFTCGGEGGKTSTAEVVTSAPPAWRHLWCENGIDVHQWISWNRRCCVRNIISCSHRRTHLRVPLS